jgi:hypothetical protein
MKIGEQSSSIRSLRTIDEEHDGTLSAKDHKCSEPIVAGELRRDLRWRCDSCALACG